MFNALRNAVRWMTAACLLFGLALTHAAVPAAINYQGFLTNPTTGVPLTSVAGVPLTVTFKLWDALTAGNLIYSETQSVTVTNGVFNVQIGAGAVQTPPNVAFIYVAFDKPYWLEITVGSETLTPRQPLASTAYAFGVANLTVSRSSANTSVGLAALQSNTTGAANTAFGLNSLSANTTGNNNTASGMQVLYTNTTGYNNTASGVNALFSNSTGSVNTASGASALSSNTTGVGNTASGGSALSWNTTGGYSTAMGTSALLGNTTGSMNTAIGQAAMISNTTGSSNTALGSGAGSGLTTGNFNIDIGNGGVAGESATIRIGDPNQSRTFVSGIRGVVTGNADAIPVLIDSAGQLGSVTGCTSGQVMQYNGTTWACATAVGPVGPPGPQGPSGLNTVPGTGTENTALGTSALQVNASGSSNTAFGSASLSSNTDGTGNTAIGVTALKFNTIGTLNTANGSWALFYNTTASKNTAVGSYTLHDQGSTFDNGGVSWDSLNTAVGYSALAYNLPYSTTSGIQNTAVGANSLSGNRIGSDNTAVGVNALQANINGSSNTVLGVAAMTSNTTANKNTAVGWNALFAQGFFNGNVPWDSLNTAVGYSALAANAPSTTGNGIQNTAVGANALVGNTTGYNNTAVGVTAMQTNTSGSFNTAIGVAAMQNATGSSNTAIGVQAGRFISGNFNIALGDGAGTGLTTGNNNIDIGHVGVPRESGIIRIGDGGTNQTATYLSGAVYGTSFNSTSDRNAKENFAGVDATAILEKVAALPIASWAFKTDPTVRHVGPMAQDFYAAFSVGLDDKHIATVDEGGVALAAIQGLYKIVQDKDAQLHAQADKIAKMEQQLERLARSMSRLEMPDVLSASRQ